MGMKEPSPDSLPRRKVLPGQQVDNMGSMFDLPGLSSQQRWQPGAPGTEVASSSFQRPLDSSGCGPLQMPIRPDAALNSARSVVQYTQQAQHVPMNDACLPDLSR